MAKWYAEQTARAGWQVSIVGSDFIVANCLDEPTGRQIVADHNALDGIANPAGIAEVLEAARKLGPHCLEHPCEACDAEYDALRAALAALDTLTGEAGGR